MKCIEDDIPFDVLEGWSWCRLGTICSEILYGLSNSAEASGSHRLLRITDIQNGCVDWESVPFTSVEEDDKYLLQPNDIVFARTGATVGKSFLITETPYKSVYASYLIRIRLLPGVNAKYIYQFFNSACYWSQITDKSVGVGQPNCNGTSLQELFIPLPPSGEQLRIVPIAEDLLEKTLSIEAEKESLSRLLYDTKSKVLDLAIRGKLIPQNQNDEPASVLLERIRTEKEELIKQGKLKRDKKESIIYKGDDNSYYEKLSDGTVKSIDEDLPFEIPNNWHWERIRNLFIINPKNNISDNTMVSFIPMALLDDGYSGKYSSEEKVWNDCKKGFTHFSDGDVCFAKISPCFENRKSAYFNDLSNGYGAGTTELYVLRRYTDDIVAEYLLSFVKSEYFISRGRNTFSGVVGQQRVDKEVMLDTFIPLPPSAEQIRITDMISKAFSEIAKIEDSIN
ncbi:restriction endonuclease subunit S [Butyrivibrio sp. VCB2001]|uniref:restriction endonuclease subunit S n=1 Tax=Butyrivibrio sp. VCB2001 TaxID=1280667 RepID=UPI0018CB9560|nr:restriction endonuclease subunit S [Butyrivibrio sp. VCB2001]